MNDLDLFGHVPNKYNLLQQEMLGKKSKMDVNSNPKWFDHIWRYDNKINMNTKRIQ